MNERNRRGVLEHPRDLRFAQPGADRNENGAQPADGDHGDDRLHMIAKHHRDALSLTHSAREKVGAEIRGHPIELPIGDTPIAVDDGRHFG